VLYESLIVGCTLGTPTKAETMVEDDDDAEAACLQKLGDILTNLPPGGRRRNDGPAEIVEHVYLGSMVDALDLDLLRRLRITHVLNCAPAAVRRYADSLRVAADDCPSSWRSNATSCDQRPGASSFTNKKVEYNLWNLKKISSQSLLLNTVIIKINTGELKAGTRVLLSFYIFDLA